MWFYSDFCVLVVHEFFEGSYLWSMDTRFSLLVSCQVFTTWSSGAAVGLLQSSRTLGVEMGCDGSWLCVSISGKCYAAGYPVVAKSQQSLSRTFLLPTSSGKVK